VQPTPDTEQSWIKTRRFPRYKTNLPLKVRKLAETTVSGQCNIIAGGGLGGILPQPLPVGDVVLLEFLVPTHSSSMRVWALVRYQQELQHGFEFLSLTPAQRLSVREFCHELALQSATHT
jgi:hypothetical protein